MLVYNYTYMQKEIAMKRAYIVLANGETYSGYRFGAEKNTQGELVFTTGMCGYMETLTDPGFAGQMVLQTFPLIGNYGYITADEQSGKCYPAAYIVREICDYPSNFRCEGTLDSYLKEKNIPGICGVDTRLLTKRIRDLGCINACITEDPSKVDLNALKNDMSDAAGACGAKEKYICECENEKYNVALVDFGTTKEIIDLLVKADCTVTVLPAGNAAAELKTGSYDGLLLSNGPGNPEAYQEAIQLAKDYMGKIPMFGISLGHQIMALAQGGSVEKLPYGHRGANQPVRCLENGKILTTCQNHGYTVNGEGMNITHENVIDGTCEGLLYPDLKAVSLQFTPEAEEMDRFIQLMGGNK